MTPFYTILTNYGKTVLAEALAAQQPLKIPHMAVGDGGGEYYEPTEAQTNLRNEQWRGNLNDLRTDEELQGQVIAEAVIPHGIDGDWTAREIGLFDAKGGLIAVGKYPETYIPSALSGATSQVYINIIIKVDNVAALELIVDHGQVLASKQFTLEQAIKILNITQLRVNTIADLIDAAFNLNDVVNVAGYYTAFDGAQHFRFISQTDDGTGVQMRNGLWANIIIDGDACVDWFGAKGDGVTDDWWAINKAINASISTAYQGNWEKTSNRSPKFNVRLSRRSYRHTKPILLPPYLKFYGMGSRWYFSGVDNSRLIPDFDNRLQFAVQSANYVVATQELVGQGWFSGVHWLDKRRLTFTHGIETHGYSIEPKKQILGGVRLVGSPISKVYDIYATNIDYGVLLNCSWCTTVDVKTNHYKVGVMSSHDGNNSHVDGYLSGAVGDPLPGNPYLNPLETLDSTTGLSLQKISDPKSKIGVIFYWSQGSTSKNLTCEGNDISLAIAKGAADVRCLYSERNASSSICGYNSQLTVGEITGAEDGSTFCMGVNNTWRLEKDTQTGVAQRFLYVNEWGNQIYVPNTFYEYARGVHVDGFDFSRVYVDAINGNDSYIGSEMHPVKTLERAITRVRDVYVKSNTLLKTPRDRTIHLMGSSIYEPTQQHVFSGGSMVFLREGSGEPSIRFPYPLRLSDITMTFDSLALIRTTDNHGSGENGALFIEDGIVNVMVRNCRVDLLKYSFIYPRYLYAGTLSLFIRNSSVRGDSSTAVIQAAYQNDNLHLIHVNSYKTTYSGGIESRADKGFEIPQTRRGNILGVSL